MQRPAWGTFAAILNWLIGLSIVSSSVGLIGITAFSADLLSNVGGTVGLSIVAAPAVVVFLGAVVWFLFGVLRCVAGYGLWSLKNWGRIMAIVLHILAALAALGGIVLFVVSGGFLTAIFPLIAFALEAVFAVGLLLGNTAIAYRQVPHGGDEITDRITAVAPPHTPGGFGEQSPAPFGNHAYPPQQFAPTHDHSPQAVPPTIGPAAPAPAPVGAPPAPLPLPPTEAEPVAAPGPSASGGYGVPGRAGNVARTELANPEPETLAWLVERNGPRPGREYRLRDQVTLGRDPSRCELVLDDTKVSGEHARVRSENGQFVIYDLASTNHTFVNGQEVQKHRLRDGDQICLGPNVMLVFMRVGK